MVTIFPILCLLFVSCGALAQHDIVAKQSELYRLRFSINQLYWKVAESCPNFNKVSIGRRRETMPTAERLDLDIELAKATYDHLLRQYQECQASLTGITTPETTTIKASTTKSTTTTTTTSTTSTPTTSPVILDGHAFTILRVKPVYHKGYSFLALEVVVPKDGRSKTISWCKDYQNLCESFRRRPTSCAGTNHVPSCRKYNAGINVNGNNGHMGCSPSRYVNEIAQQAFPDGSARSYYNTFAFLYCTSLHCSNTISKDVTALSLDSMRSFYNEKAPSRIMYTTCQY
ncbi:uncharacterized protein LOC106181956 [Lingula anatina]|uniref:Uncharacterized protein LOC106181956 n=1 Tax=Lingula anatina TaxID=7574 RepID=A0A1S3KIE1_LINAN|nr:uncharacterized protein LOC106181956 [Lingula anatina]|eukprot:XP_013421981.1 uncharacterized protein LOC106181956 [Lingula anatina]